MIGRSVAAAVTRAGGPAGVGLGNLFSPHNDVTYLPFVPPPLASRREVNGTRGIQAGGEEEWV